MNLRQRAFSIILGLVLLSSTQVQAQSYTIDILGGNTLNGVLQGSVMGASTMAIANSKNIAPVRIGVGLGILYGLGVGVYDINAFGGNKLMVKGFINNGNNTTIIVLLDTLYGAAAGAVIVTAGMLVANEPLITGLQYGSGIGAWLGFGFGVFDAFILAEREQTTDDFAFLSNNSNSTGSFINIKNADSSVQLGLIRPSLNSKISIAGDAILAQPRLGVDGLTLSVRF